MFIVSQVLLNLFMHFPRFRVMFLSIWKNLKDTVIEIKFHSLRQNGVGSDSLRNGPS